jgi:hypothetical protein
MHSNFGISNTDIVITMDVIKVIHKSHKVIPKSNSHSEVPQSHSEVQQSFRSPKKSFRSPTKSFRCPCHLLFQYFTLIFQIQIYPSFALVLPTEFEIMRFDCTYSDKPSLSTARVSFVNTFYFLLFFF